MAEIVEVLSEREVPVALCTLVSNLAGFYPCARRDRSHRTLCPQIIRSTRLCTLTRAWRTKRLGIQRRH